MAKAKFSHLLQKCEKFARSRELSHIAIRSKTCKEIRDYLNMIQKWFIDDIQKVLGEHRYIVVTDAKG